jgi:hypothetical protein
MMSRDDLVRTAARGLALSTGLSLLFVACKARGADAAVGSRADAAPALVQAALDAEAAGAAASRSELLDRAMAADPDFAPARWQAGQVKFDGRWRSADEVAALVAHDARWTGYRSLLASLGRTPADHLVLAEYCSANNLENEGRYHWTNVLLVDPGNRAARAYLHVGEYRGQLLRYDDIDAQRDLEKRAEANLKTHRARMAELCRDATNGNAQRRQAALAAIRAIDDPTALEALERAAEKACEKAGRLADDLHLAVVAALSNMPQHEATLRLLSHALAADSAGVRKRASEGLRQRPETDYVPILMAALKNPIEADVDVLTTPDGSVRVIETYVQDGPEATREHARRINYETEGVFAHDLARVSSAAVLHRNLGAAAAVLRRTQTAVATANANAERLNQRIEEVLRVALAKDLDETPQAWWADWQAYNELQSAADLQVQRSYEDWIQVYHYPEPQAKAYRTPQPIPRDENRPRSCFVAGTPVWTQAGPVSIESIAIGDMVLTQNPETGELGYRAVLATTVGTPTGVVDLAIGTEKIGSTLGHRFWVLGRGWTMAKYLEPATPLHALGGFAEVRSVAKAEIVECYNLEVADFHTYFVGDARLLVHDKTCPAPALPAIPGSARHRAWREAPPTLPAKLER